MEKEVVSYLNSLISKDSDEYESIINELKSKIKNDVQYRKEKVNDLEISQGNLLTLLVLTRIFNKDKDLKLSESFFDSRFDIKQPGTYNKYFNKLITLVAENNDYPKYSPEYISFYISECLDELSIFSTQNVLYQKGSTISIFDMIQMEKNSKELYEAMHYEDDPSEIRIDKWNKKRNEILKRGIEAIKNNTYKNSIHEYIDSRTGINTKQLAEVIFNIGYKPDSFGKVIPTRIPVSFLTGLQNVQQYYIDCIGARTALITSKNQVKKSGYYTRKTTSATTESRIAKIDDCHTKKYLRYVIKDDNDLKRFRGRYYYDKETDTDKMIDIDNDTNLIGKAIKLRTPIFCALNDGKVCHKCYGDLWKRNQGLNIGIIAALTLTEPTTQKTLSAKHLLSVNVNDLNLPERFKNYFVLENATNISLNTSNPIIIYREDLLERENRQIDKFSTDTVYVLDGKEEIKLHFDRQLTINDKLSREYPNLYDEDKEAYIFGMDNISTDDVLFKFNIENNGVAKPLMDVKNIYERNGFIQEANYDIDVIFNEISSKMLISGTNIQSVHPEIILKPMVFFNDDPRFDRNILSETDEIEYTVKNITDSILYSNSITKSLAFQYVHKQLSSDTYGTLVKDGESMFDNYMK